MCRAVCCNHLLMAPTAHTVLWMRVIVSMLAMEATPRPSSDSCRQTESRVTVWRSSGGVCVCVCVCVLPAERSCRPAAARPSAPALCPAYPSAAGPRSRYTSRQSPTPQPGTETDRCCPAHTHTHTQRITHRAHQYLRPANLGKVF